MTNIDPAIVEALKDGLTRDPAEEFAVVVAALLAGRIDAQQAIASLAARNRRFIAAAEDAARAEGYEQGKAAVREAVDVHLAAPGYTEAGAPVVAVDDLRAALDVTP